MKLPFHFAPVLLLLATGACGRAGSVAPVTTPTPVAAKSAPVAATVTAPTAKADRATTDEVVSAVVAVFGDSAVLHPADSASIADDPIWDINVRSYETHDRVEHYVGLFSNSAKERFLARLSRGTRYEPMIRAKLRASGMPEDLTYLALIESGYDPHAYSRAAAVGMWQFMSGTARGVGMRVDWWMDERRDPARSTDGAIRFLRDLQKQFGSLYLAAAAYNGGPGRVARGLTRFASEMDGAEGEDRFFALAEQDYLRAETKNYVPQIIAAALVAKMPARYGLVIDSLPLYGYDSVLVTPGTSLAHIAAASGATKAEVRDLNPAVLRGITPPDASIWARVPVGLADRTRLALDSIPEEDRRGFRMASVSGSTGTPAGFADAHGVTVKQLRWFNPTIKTTKKGRLVAGQSLRIPSDLAIDFAREIPDPGIERYGGSSPTTLTSRGIHVVKRGESLGAIAKRYGTTVPRLKSLNGIKGSRVIAGQTLRVRSGTSTASSTSSSAKKSAAKKASAKKASAKKATVKKSGAKKSTAKKKPVAKKKTASSKKKTPPRK
ncbi:lytic transglycosylase domain-containing protein [Gemmatimonas groenlandica]|uniref:Transglycosylase SLT domain-containing protein n=1 Tax=Gemmatimonas groenlandica TaxID=2732249 RepID=A0A6M4IQN2_9BACT|nr:lytic transglycosylase domain-containing protein [Gemmatimonas groenlandica]QJR34571.1 transglycosylase SLT domain-containing protein [Gemmatimonas groenlandica]